MKNGEKFVSPCQLPGHLDRDKEDPDEDENEEDSDREPDNSEMKAFYPSDTGTEYG